MVSGACPYRLDRVTRALVPPVFACTTLRTDRPARPVASVPGSAPTGEAAQEPTQVPAEAGAADEPWGRRPVAEDPEVLSPAADLMRTVTERATTSATNALSRA